MVTCYLFTVEQSLDHWPSIKIIKSHVFQHIIISFNSRIFLLSFPYIDLMVLLSKIIEDFTWHPKVVFAQSFLGKICLYCKELNRKLLLFHFWLQSMWNTLKRSNEMFRRYQNKVSTLENCLLLSCALHWCPNSTIRT